MSCLSISLYQIRKDQLHRAFNRFRIAIRIEIDVLSGLLPLVKDVIDDTIQFAFTFLFTVHQTHINRRFLAIAHNGQYVIDAFLHLVFARQGFIFFNPFTQLLLKGLHFRRLINGHHLFIDFWQFHQTFFTHFIHADIIHHLLHITHQSWHASKPNHASDRFKAVIRLHFNIGDGIRKGGRPRIKRTDLIGIQHFRLQVSLNIEQLRHGIGDRCSAHQYRVFTWPDAFQVLRFHKQVSGNTGRSGLNTFDGALHGRKTDFLMVVGFINKQEVNTGIFKTNAFVASDRFLQMLFQLLFQFALLAFQLLASRIITVFHFLQRGFQLV